MTIVEQDQYSEPIELISLKDLIFKEDKELSLWYQEFRHNLLDLLADVEIDKIDGSPLYHILISEEYDEFYKLFSKIAPKFTHKNIKGK